MRNISEYYFVGPTLRRERELTIYKKQIDFAHAIGISQSMLSLIESNRKQVDQEFAQQCASILGIPVERLTHPDQIREDNTEVVGTSGVTFDQTDPREKEIVLLKAIINAQAGQINSLEDVVNFLKEGSKRSGEE